MLIMDPTSYGSPTVHGDMNTIRVGKYCSIANSAVFDGGMQHNHKAVTSYPLWRLGYGDKVEGGMCKGDINIGNDVWIGDGALIMSGVTIGDGAVIGARAVVCEDVFPYSITVGVPARMRGWRHPSNIVDRLIALKWWNWEAERVRANIHLLLSENIEEFLNANEGK